MSFVFSKKSKKNLIGVNPKMMIVSECAIAICPHDFMVLDGLRTLKEQAEFVRRKVSKTMKSRHLPDVNGIGNAVDLVPVDEKGAPFWEEQWNVTFVVAASVQQVARILDFKVIWGGVWDRTLNDMEVGVEGLKREVEAYKIRHAGVDFLDGPHFEAVR